MGVSFQSVILDSCVDSEAMLVFREGRLVAVVSRLSDLHAGLAGRWFVESTFDAAQRLYREAFDDLADIENWIEV